jgi:hypothetical protein
MAPRDSILNGPVTEVLQLLSYAAHFPDFPKNLSSIHPTPDNFPLPQRGEGTKVALYILASLSSVAVLARIWARKWYQHAPLWWDDYTACFSLLCVWALTTIQLLGFYLGGAGIHTYDVSRQALAYGLRLEFGAQIVYVTTALAIKTSIFLFLLRLTPPRRKVLRRVIIWTMIFLYIMFLVQIITVCNACTPHAGAWNLTIRLKSYSCLNWQKFVVGFNVFWSLTDVWTLLLPVTLVWNLNVSYRKRAATLALFHLGGLACIASVVKIFYLRGIYNTWDPTCKS